MCDGGISRANAFVGDVLRQIVLTMRDMPTVFLHKIMTVFDFSEVKLHTIELFW